MNSCGITADGGPPAVLSLAQMLAKYLIAYLMVHAQHYVGTGAR